MNGFIELKQDYEEAALTYGTLTEADRLIAALEEECKTLQLALLELKTPLQPSAVAQAHIIELEAELATLKLEVAQFEPEHDRLTCALAVAEAELTALREKSEDWGTLMHEVMDERDAFEQAGKRHCSIALDNASLLDGAYEDIKRLKWMLYTLLTELGLKGLLASALHPQLLRTLAWEDKLTKDRVLAILTGLYEEDRLKRKEDNPPYPAVHKFDGVSE